MRSISIEEMPMAALEQTATRLREVFPTSFKRSLDAFFSRKGVILGEEYGLLVYVREGGQSTLVGYLLFSAKKTFRPCQYAIFNMDFTLNEAETSQAITLAMQYVAEHRYIDSIIIRSRDDTEHDPERKALYAAGFEFRERVENYYRNGDAAILFEFIVREIKVKETMAYYLDVRNLLNEAGINNMLKNSEFINLANQIPHNAKTGREMVREIAEIPSLGFEKVKNIYSQFDYNKILEMHAIVREYLDKVPDCQVAQICLQILLAQDYRDAENILWLSDRLELIEVPLDDNHYVMFSNNPLDHFSEFLNSYYEIFGFDWKNRPDWQLFIERLMRSELIVLIKSRKDQRIVAKTHCMLESIGKKESCIYRAVFDVVMKASSMDAAGCLDQKRSLFTEPIIPMPSGIRRILFGEASCVFTNDKGEGMNYVQIFDRIKNYLEPNISRLIVDVAAAIRNL